MLNVKSHVTDPFLTFGMLALGSPCASVSWLIIKYIITSSVERKEIFDAQAGQICYVVRGNAARTRILFGTRCRGVSLYVAELLF